MNILLIDDDPMILLVLKKGLENLQHKITMCDNAYKALLLVEKNNFDFILSDIYMKDLSGLAFANILQEHIDNSIPILLMSSNENIGEIIENKFGPLYCFIQKPFSITELLAKIDECKTKKQLPA